jgi:hypothetical protein
MNRFHAMFGVVAIVALFVSRDSHAQCYAIAGEWCSSEQDLDDGGYAYWGIATQGIGVWGKDTSTGMGVAGTAGSSTVVPPTDIPAGVYGSYTGSGGYGGYFTSDTSQGIYASSTSTSGQDAIYGVTSATSGNKAGVKGESGESGGYGVAGVNTGSGYGVYGISTSGNAVWGDISAQTSGTNAAVYGNSDSNGYGIYGITNDGVAGVYGTTAYTYGVEGKATNTSGIGVYGTASAGDGVHGVATSSYSGVAGVNTGSGNGVYGTSSTGYAGKFVGTVDVTGELTVGSCSGCTSDIRLKKNVKPLESAIDQLLQLKGVTFEWKDPAAHENHTGTQTGFVAQDVEKVFPEWVKDGGYTAPDGHKYKTLETRQIEALEVESIRTLKGQIEQLKEQVRTLENGGHPVVGAMGSFGGVGTGNLALSLLTLIGAYAISRKKKAEATS